MWLAPMCAMRLKNGPICDVVNPALYMLKAAKARVNGTPPSDGFITSRDVPEGYVADAARDKALSGKRIASMYIDDICVHGKVAEHTDSLAKILKRLRGNNVSLKMVKCEFVVTTGKFLGHVVKAGEGTVADPKKVQGIVAMKRPTTVAHLRTLLGASSYLRKFIPDYSDMTRPLRTIQNHYRSKHSEIMDCHWQEEHEEAFKALKASLCSAPVLAFPDWSKSFIICCDASGTQLGTRCARWQTTASRGRSSMLAGPYPKRNRTGASVIWR